VSGRRFIYSLLALLAMGGASYLALLGLDSLPNELEPGDTTGAEGLWHLALDVGAAVLAIIVGLLLLFVVLVLLAAVLLRLPGLAWLSRWIARQRCEPDFYQSRWGRFWRRPARALVAIVDSLVGYELIVDDFHPLAGGAGAAANGSSASSAQSSSSSGGDLATDAAMVTAAVRAALGASGLPPAPGGVDFVKARRTEGSALNAISDAIKEVPEVKWLAPLLRLVGTVLPRQTLVVHGDVFPAGQRGRGLALALAQSGGGVSVTERLWEQTYDPRVGSAAGPGTPESRAEGLHRLGVAAAAWVVYQVLDAEGTRGEKELLGTKDWHSYAYFRAGLECHEGGHVDQAQALYTRALERDPNNLAAVLNLAVLTARNGVGANGGPQAANLERAIDRLAALKEHLARRQRLEYKPGSDGASRLLGRDPLWYQATYQLVSARLHRATAASLNRKPAEKELARAWKEGLELTTALETTLDQLQRNPWPKHRARQLTDVLERVEDPSLVLLASVALERRAEPVQIPPTQGTTSRAALLSCLRDADPNRESAETEDRANEAVALDEYIVETYLGREKRPTMSYRARYNLACYHSRRAASLAADSRRKSWKQRKKLRRRRDQEAERALYELRFGIEAANLIVWAEQDPSLAWLRKQRGSEVNAILDSYGPRSGEHSDPSPGARGFTAAGNGSGG
jgi:hypothetical protein